MRSSKCNHQTSQQVHTTSYYNYTATKLQDHQNYASTTTTVTMTSSVFQNYTLTFFSNMFITDRKKQAPVTIQ